LQYRQEFSLAGVFAILFAVFAVPAGGIYWLMKPSVAENRGLAAYTPPPKTVINDVPWVPPASDEPPPIVRPSEAPREVVRAAAPPPKIDPRAREARAMAAARPQRVVRPRPMAQTGFFGFRPWF
jgi:hypothetical protein